MITFTEWAIDIISRAHHAARRLNPDARVRLARAAAGLEAQLVDEAGQGDEEHEVGEIVVFVERGLDGLVDIEEPHDRIVLRPHGSPPNDREH